MLWSMYLHQIKYFPTPFTLRSVSQTARVCLRNGCNFCTTVAALPVNQSFLSTLLRFTLT
jgi:hypothetical protein